MEFHVYIRAKNRITGATMRRPECKISCQDCPLSGHNSGKRCRCSTLEYFFPEVAEAIVQDWLDKHPVRTLKEVVESTFPNINKNHMGYPAVCPKVLGYTSKCGVEPCSGMLDKNKWEECWNQPYDEGEMSV